MKLDILVKLSWKGDLWAQFCARSAFAGSILAVLRLFGIVGTVPKIEKWIFLVPLAKISNWKTHHFSLPLFSLLQPPSNGPFL